MSDQPDTSNQSLAVRVLAPTSILYNGKAVSVTANNKVGQFDVLVGHANFFSLLSESRVMVNTGSEKLEFPIRQGLIKVAGNSVTLFVDIEPIFASGSS